MSGNTFGARGPAPGAGWLARGLLDAAAGVYVTWAYAALEELGPARVAWLLPAAGLALLAVGRAWWSGRGGGPGWRGAAGLLLGGWLLLAVSPAGAGAALVVAGAWRLLAGGLDGVVRIAAPGREPGAGDHGRVLLLFLLGAVSLAAYLSPNLVGPKDARWYGNAALDFLTRVRAGEFPVFSGESIYAFNGNVQLVRSAPAHLHLAALLDLLTLRALTPLAVQHLALEVCYLGGILLLYAGLSRLRPGAAGTACLGALVYAMSPALLTLLVTHDMFMSFTALPALVFTCLAAARAVERGAWRDHAAVGAGCAAMWYAHPPVAFLGTIAAGLLLGARALGHGLERRWLAGCALTAAVFGWLAGPYFYAMGEIPPTHLFDPVPNLVLPAFGLYLLVVSLGRLGAGHFRWLAGLALAGYTLHEFKPSLEPFAAILAALFAVGCALDRRWPAWGIRPRPEAWLLVSALAAAAASARWAPASFLPARGIVAGVVGRPFASVGEFLGFVVQGSDSVPHAAWWWLLGGGLVLVWRTPSGFARSAFAVALGAVACILPLPLIKAFIWGNTTIEVWDILVDADWLRFWPFALPVLLVAVILMVADLPAGGRARRIVTGGLVLLLPWAAWVHAGIVRSIHVRGAAETARLYRPENVILQSYSWDLLRQPAFYLNGVIDPRLEVRLWRQGPGRELLLDPDRIAQALEREGGQRVAPAARQDPTYPEWVYFTPGVELASGEQKVLRFEFGPTVPAGWLILRGREIYREYRLPVAGLDRSFGAGPRNTRSVLVANTGSGPETLEVVLKREGDGARGPLPATPLLAYTVSTYDPRRAPVQVQALSPLRLRVNAPEKGMLEVFRSAYPGYRVSVNGRPVPYVASRDGLVSLAVPAGESEVVVRFRGTWQLRLAYWTALGSWFVVFGALSVWAVRSTRARPATA
jgi:hypothetical protein